MTRTIWIPTRRLALGALVACVAVGCVDRDSGGGDGGSGGEIGGAGGSVGGAGGEVGGSGGGQGGSGGDVGGSGGAVGGAGGAIGGGGGEVGGGGGSVGGAGGLQEPEKHRPVAEACDDERPMQPFELGPDEEYGEVECRSHEACDQGRNGRCVFTRFGTACTYDECITDDDCGAGSVCQCNGGFYSDNNVCLSQGECQTDGDCGANGYCSPSFGDCGDYSGVVGWFCHTADDECVDDADCGDGESWGDYCAFMPGTGRWQCSNSHCAGK